MKWLRYILLPAWLIITPAAVAQSGSKPKKMRKKDGPRWRKSGEPHNPYLRKKARNKPSAKLARAEKKAVKKQKRSFKREARRAKRGARRK